MAKIIRTTFQLRRGLSSDWHLADPILAPGEPGFELDTGRLKVGNGVAHYNSLPYISGGGAATIKGVVSTVADLPSSDNTDGDMYVVEEDGHTYIWVTDQWNDAGPIIDLTGYATLSDLNYKVDKVTGKGLSTNDFTSDLLTKLNGIEAGAQVNPDLSTYATLASPHLTGVPIAPTASKGSDTTQIATTAFVQQELADFAPTDYMKKGVDYVTAGRIQGTLGTKATAEGYDTIASGNYSHAEGYGTRASGTPSHAEGSNTTASGINSHAEGSGTTTASGTSSHAEGYNTTASGAHSHAEGDNTLASGNYSHAQNKGTIAASNEQTALGRYNIADNNAVYAEIVGNGTKDSARSNARTLDWSGNEILAGKLTVGAGPTNAMDVATKQYVDNAVPGSNTYMVKGLDYVTAGKKDNTTLGTKATVEGYNNTASGNYTHAEGNGTVANANTAHAEGTSTTAQGVGAHAEGRETTANGSAAHSEGYSTTAAGDFSHATGKGTKANRQSQYVFGEYNVPETGAANARGTYVEIVGSGTGISNTANARTLDWSGNEWLAGTLKVGGTSDSDVNAQEVATKNYVDSNNNIVSITITNQSAADVYAEIDAAYNAKKLVVLFVPNVTHRENNVAEVFTLAEKYSWDYGSQEGIDYIFKSIYDDTKVSGYTVEYISTSDQYVMGYDTTIALAPLQSPALTGTPTVPNLTSDSSATQIANKGYVDGKADIASPTFTGTPAAPTATTGTNTTQLATTAFVQQEIVANIPDLTSYMVKGSDYVTAGQKSNTTLGSHATAEGVNATVSGARAHGEGQNVTASGADAHAEGDHTTASGAGSHAEGYYSQANGNYAHASGYNTRANGQCSTALGVGTQAIQDDVLVFGKYNTDPGYQAPSLSGMSQAGVNIFDNADGTAVFRFNVMDPDTGTRINNALVFNVDYTANPMTLWLDINQSVWYADLPTATLRIWEEQTVAPTQEIPLTSFVLSNPIYIQSPCYDIAVLYKNNSDTQISNINATPGFGMHYLEIVGNGAQSSARTNARTLDWSGNQWLAGTIKIGGTGYTDVNAQEVATKAEIAVQSTSALVTQTSTLTTNVTIMPNTTVTLPGSTVITSLNVTLGAPVDGYATQYTLIFTAGSNLACTFTATSGYAIKDMSGITFTSGKVQYLNFVVLHGQVNGSDETIIGVRHEEY